MSRKHKKNKQKPLQTTTEEAKPEIINMNIDTVNCIIHENKLFRRVEEDGFRGFFQVQVAQEKPTLSWVGKKIPISLWLEVCAFFEWGFKTYNGENQVRLFYNPQTLAWKAWAFPQKASGGLTTVEIGDHPDRKRQDEEIGTGFRLYGTIHHHCKMSAFQSGVDRDNETSQNGIHITIGNISEDKYSTHFRVVMSKMNIDADLNQWFELPTEWVTTPFKFHEDLIKYLLHTPPPKDYPFPEVWKSNVIKEPIVTNHCFAGDEDWRSEYNRGSGLALPERSGAAIKKPFNLFREKSENIILDMILAEAYRLNIGEHRMLELIKHTAQRNNCQTTMPDAQVLTHFEEEFCKSVELMIKKSGLLFWRVFSAISMALNESHDFAV